jgi:ferredoxin--NADP+ reductase
MCGGCRVDVGGETRFACVDGPEFDAHLVDFDLLDRRNRAYLEFEGDRREDLADLDACRIEELLAPVRGTDAS